MKKYIMKIFSKYLERIDMLLQVRTVNSMVIGNEHFSKDTVFSDRLAMDKQMVFQTKYDFSNNGEDK